MDTTTAYRLQDAARPLADLLDPEKLIQRVFLKT